MKKGIKEWLKENPENAIYLFSFYALFFIATFLFLIFSTFVNQL
jgi:hypothetical protein